MCVAADASKNLFHNYNISGPVETAERKWLLHHRSPTSLWHNITVYLETTCDDLRADIVHCLNEQRRGNEVK